MALLMVGEQERKVRQKEAAEDLSIHIHTQQKPFTASSSSGLGSKSGHVAGSIREYAEVYCKLLTITDKMWGVQAWRRVVVGCSPKSSLFRGEGPYKQPK